MRWSKATPDWEELSRRVSRHWSNITPAHLAHVAGSRQALVGLITELSRLSTDQANRELDKLEQRCRVYFRPAATDDEVS